MNLAYLRVLLDYHYWARDRVLAAAAVLSAEQYERDIGGSFPSVRDTLNHIYMAEWVWYSRWTGTSPTAFPDAGQLAEFTMLGPVWMAHEAKVRAFVGALGESDIERVFDYTTFNGTPARSKFWEMFVHVVNHASYHRGQVTTLLRQLGAPPPESMDMIAFFRTLSPQ